MAFNSVKNSYLLEKIWGYIPTFHDGKVVSLSFSHRNGFSKLPDLILGIHYWGQGEISERGRGTDCIVTMEFSEVSKIATEISDESIAGTWILDMQFELTDTGLICFELEPSSGTSIKLICQAVEISGILCCDKDGKTDSKEIK